jgi:hypothetical protein
VGIYALAFSRGIHPDALSELTVPQIKLIFEAMPLVLEQ